jgi:diacylglycerol kinase family enzyme
VVARPDLVLNRRARYLAGEGPVRRALLEAARDVGARVHETTTLSELDEAARSIASDGTACVVLAGGDGSYMAGVTALVRAFGEAAVPPIALAPGGTVGTVARNWVEDRSARAVVTAAASAGALERATLRPTLRVTDDAGGDRVGFIFGAGLVARFFDARRGRGTRGPRQSSPGSSQAPSPAEHSPGAFSSRWQPRSRSTAAQRMRAPSAWCSRASCATSAFTCW